MNQPKKGIQNVPTPETILRAIHQDMTQSQLRQEDEEPDEELEEEKLKNAYYELEELKQAKDVKMVDFSLHNVASPDSKGNVMTFFIAVTKFEALFTRVGAIKIIMEVYYPNGSKVTSSTVYLDPYPVTKPRFTQSFVCSVKENVEKARVCLMLWFQTKDGGCMFISSTNPTDCNRA